MKENIQEILNAIKEQYGKDRFIMAELHDILLNCGYRKHEVRIMLQEAIDKKLIGRVVYRKVKRNLPNKNATMVI